MYVLLRAAKFTDRNVLSPRAEGGKVLDSDKEPWKFREVTGTRRVVRFGSEYQRVSVQIDFLTLISGLSSLSSFSLPPPAFPVTLLLLLLLKTRANEEDRMWVCV